MAFKVAECDCVYETEWRGDERWSKRGKDTPTYQKKSLFESSLCLSLAQTTIMHTNISVHFPLITGNNKFLNRVVSTNDTLSCSLSLTDNSMFICWPQIIQAVILQSTQN